VAPSLPLQPGGAAIVGLRRKRMELELKTPWRDGTTHLVMSPLEFMQRLAALIQPAATAFANGCCQSWPSDAWFGSVSNRRELRLDGEELTLKLSSLEVAAPGVYCAGSPCRVL